MRYLTAPMNPRLAIPARARFLLALFPLGLLGFGACGARQTGETVEAQQGVSDEEQIVGAWTAYREALKGRDGKKAVSGVTRASIEDYANARARALHATREELATLSTMDRLLAVSLRARLSREVLEKADGRELLALTIDRGWVGEDLDVDVQVERIEGDLAFVQLRRGEHTLPESYPLVRKEENRWRVDLHELIRIGEAALERELQKLANESETDLDGAILIVLSMILERQVDESIWEPLVKP